MKGLKRTLKLEELHLLIRNLQHLLFLLVDLCLKIEYLVDEKFIALEVSPSAHFFNILFQASHSCLKHVSFLNYEVFNVLSLLTVSVIAYIHVSV